MSTPAVSLRQRASSVQPRQIGAGTYVTDEKGLYRCVSVAPANEPGATALFEDCLTLELVVLPMDRLASEGLRIVQPAAGGAESEPVLAAPA